MLKWILNRFIWEYWVNAFCNYSLAFDPQPVVNVQHQLISSFKTYRRALWAWSVGYLFLHDESWYREYLVFGCYGVCDKLLTKALSCRYDKRDPNVRPVLFDRVAAVNYFFIFEQFLIKFIEKSIHVLFVFNMWQNNNELKQIENN